ncbi:MAG: ATP-binding protein [Candidatus Limnocylindrales bacterium]
MNARTPTLPTGTVTFLRTDVEGSMALTQALGGAWDDINAAHLELIRGAVQSHGGTAVRTEGDALFAVFPEAGAATVAAVEAQRALAGHPWPDGARIRVRMGLHSGEAHLAGADYGGFEVNRAARVAAVGHGGQIVVSGPTYELIADALPAGVEARDLGRYVLKDVPRPERLYQLDVAGLATAFPPLRAGRTTTGNLSPRLTTFVGRDREAAELAALLGSSRLVTITGPGGIGKSSLAVEVVRSVESDFPDGAWFVPLATVDESDAVAPLVARTIGLYDGTVRSAIEALPTFVADRSMVFVVDNFEHVLEAAGVVGDLVRWSPGSRVVVTSRAPLHLGGEQEYPLGPLSTGPDGDAAGRLFLERARAVRPGWNPGSDAPIVAEICALVDGLPLGVELAAARVSLLPPATIRDRLAAHLPLPGTGVRDAPDRQRTLERAVAWSHDLLPADLQARFHRLAVFEGGFDVEQAGPVTRDPDAAATDEDGDILDDLARLADENLIARDPSTVGVRFRLLRTIQSFATARLVGDGDEPAVRRRHADAFLALAREAQRHESDADRAVWLDRLAADEANLRTAVLWAIDAAEADLAMHLVAALWRFWQADGHLTEGRQFAERVLAMPGADVLSESRMWAVAAAGSIAYWQADPTLARARYEEQLALAQSLDDVRGIVDALFNIGHASFVGGGEAADAAAWLDEVRRRYHDLGDERGVARADWAVGNMSLADGRPAEALTMFSVALDRFAELGDAQYHAMAVGSMAWANFALGDRRAAVGWAIRALRETFAQRDLGTTAISLHSGILVAVYTGHAEDGARLHGAFDAARERYGVRPPAGLERFVTAQDPFRLVREAVSPERFEAAYEEGRRLSLGEAVDLVAAMAEGSARSGQTQ